MKHIINKAFTLILFIISMGCAYAALIIPFASSFINIILLITAVFFLLQACGNIDKENGFGEYNQDKQHHFHGHHQNENMIDDNDCSNDNDDNIPVSTEEEEVVDNDTNDSDV